MAAPLRTWELGARRERWPGRYFWAGPLFEPFHWAHSEGLGDWAPHLIFSSASCSLPFVRVCTTSCTHTRTNEKNEPTRQRPTPVRTSGNAQKAVVESRGQPSSNSFFPRFGPTPLPDSSGSALDSDPNDPNCRVPRWNAKSNKGRVVLTYCAHANQRLRRLFGKWNSGPDSMV